MAYRSLRSTTSFLRNPISVSKIQPLLPMSSLHPETNTNTTIITNSTPICHYHSQTLGSGTGYPPHSLRPYPNGHPSLRPLCTTTVAWSPEAAARQTTEPSSAEGGGGSSGYDSSSSSSSDDSSSSSDDSSSSSSSGDDSSHDEAGDGFDSVDSIRAAVLDASLEFVSQFGWTEEAIAAGAESLGYSSMTHGLVEGGGGELFNHLQRRLNDDLEEELQRVCQQEKEHPHSKMSKSAFIEAALKHRLSLMVPYLGVWSKGLVVTAMSPTTAQKGLHNIATMANHVCRYSGDISISTEWYAKRAAVVAVYKAAELSLLQDQSPDYQDTWEFLHRRVTEVVALEKTLTNLDGVASEAVNVGRAALRTGLNMIGLNSMAR